MQPARSSISAMRKADWPAVIVASLFKTRSNESVVHTSQVSMQRWVEGVWQGLCKQQCNLKPSASVWVFQTLNWR